MFSGPFMHDFYFCRGRNSGSRSVLITTTAVRRNIVGHQPGGRRSAEVHSFPSER